MKKIIWLLLLISNLNVFSQDARIQNIKNNIEAITADSPGLTEKVNINIKETTLTSFLLAVSEVHKINLSVSPQLNQISIVNNFTDVTVADLLVFLCKEYNLSIDFTGNILSIKAYERPVEKPAIKQILVDYNEQENLLSVDLKEDKLYDAFKKIMDASGKNLVFAPGLENKLLTSYIKNMPFEAALNKIAYGNNLAVTKSKDNFYLVDELEGNYNFDQNTDKSNTASARQNKPVRSRKSNFFFNVIDADKKLLEVDFENTPVSNIIYDIGNELGIDMYISNPMEGAGTATFKAKNITFDNLLTKLFEGRNPSSSNQSGSEDSYGFKKSGLLYYFGLKNQLTLRSIRTVALMHRSIELLGNPSSDGRSSGRLSNNSGNYTNYYGNGSSNQRNSDTNTSYNSNTSYNNNPTGQTSNYNSSSGSSGGSTSSESIISIVPDEIKKDLDIRVDKELNSFIVSGPELNIARFESFVKYIDKPVPVVLIEVMLLENNRNAIVETGISAGIGDKPVVTKGSIFPGADITLGAETINKIINNFDGFGSLNIGSVVPNFYLSLKALEANGNVKIRSTPRLSTLNGHKAFLSIGETTYYVVTNQNYYGSQIPQASEIKNYQPIDAELSVTIMPLVSGDGQITMDIKVIQSSFNGQKVDKDAPPGINSREFTSIIRVKDQDLVVLGGLEEKVKNDSGSGVPLLSRIPIIKWFFSSRKREDSKKKLTVLIKPTVIY